MATKSIEERADKFALQIDFNIHKNDGTTEVEQSIRAQGVRRGYIQGATEQDSIARQEERERCIKAAMEASCGACCFYHEGNCIHSELTGFESECSVRMKKVRKAIEEGGEE